MADGPGGVTRYDNPLGRFARESAKRFRCIPCGVSCTGCSFRAWGAWLDSLPWSTFAAYLTFKDWKGRDIGRIGNRITEWVWRATGQQCVAFACSEFGRRTGRLHCHALLSHGPDGCDALDRRWRRSYGITSLRPYDRGRGAAYYVGKYVLKEAFDTGSYTISGAGPGCDRWADGQVRPFVENYGDPSEEGTPTCIPYTKKHYSADRARALRAKTPEVEAELQRNHNQNWWVDRPIKSGYQLYLDDLRGF